MSVVNTNVKALFAQNALTTNSRSLNTAMEQLSSGKRINSAANDAAGLAISDKMTSQIRGLNMAVRNINDGVSLAQTAEGAYNEIQNMLQRMRELVIQKTNETLSSDQSDYIDLELDELGEQIDDIIENTKWNTISIFDTETFEITTTEDGDTNITVSVGGTTAMDGLDNSSSVGDIDDAIDEVANNRALLGAVINRLNFAADNLANVSMNISASRSQILDTDYAQATTDLARAQIIQQAGTAMLAQANQQPASVLSLLQ
jgi:flagellin